MGGSARTAQFSQQATLQDGGMLGTNVQAAYVRLCELYDDGSAGLRRLNVCRARGVPPSIQLCIGGTLPAERRETEIEGSERGRAQMLLRR